MSDPSGVAPGLERLVETASASGSVDAGRVIVVILAIFLFSLGNAHLNLDQGAEAVRGLETGQKCDLGEFPQFYGGTK
jgi:hypothetical protein